jgi:hypothetical protein
VQTLLRKTVSRYCPLCHRLSPHFRCSCAMPNIVALFSSVQSKLSGGRPQPGGSTVRRVVLLVPGGAGIAIQTMHEEEEQT